jgi:hypothetical protein
MNHQTAGDMSMPAFPASVFPRIASYKIHVFNPLHRRQTEIDPSLSRSHALDQAGGGAR